MNFSLVPKRRSYYHWLHFTFRMRHIYKTILFKLFFLFFFFLLNIDSFAGNPKLDSLVDELKEVKDDEEKVTLLIELSSTTVQKDPQKSIEYGRMAYNLIKESDQKEKETVALRSIGRGYFAKWQLDSALVYFQSALDIAEELKQTSEIPHALNGIGIVHLQKGNYPQAIEFFYDALKLLDKEKDSKLASLVINNIGVIHWHEGRHSQAIEKFQEVLAIEKSKENNQGIAMALCNIGLIYGEIEEEDKALENYLEALKICKANKIKVFQTTLFTNIGDIYSRKNKYTEAKNSYLAGLVVARELNDKGSIILTLNGLSMLELEKNNIDLATEYAKEGLHLAEEVGNNEGIFGNKEALIQCMIKKGNFEEALALKTEFHQQKDSIYTAEKSKQILELSTKYETEKKETENRLLKEQQVKNEEIIKQQSMMVIMGFVILGLLSLLATFQYKRYNEKKRYSTILEQKVVDRTSELRASNTKLQASNKELERFAFIASHDLKEPLRNISSFINLLDRKLIRDHKKTEEIHDYIQFITKNTKQMHRLIEDVLEFSNIGKEDVNNEDINPREVVNSVLHSISDSINEKNVQLDIGHLPNVSSNASQLFIIFKNLIENGIKYNNSEPPKIAITGVNKGNFTEISIRDNGIGIDKEYQDQIFVMFKRLHDRDAYTGSGLGLSICKKIIQALGGEIWVDSEEGMGSTFTFRLPAPTSQNQVEKLEQESILS